MKKRLFTENGFTLVEILISVGIVSVFLIFAAPTLTTTRVQSSIARHKMEAAYVAQQLIETERQGTFIALIAGQSRIIGPSSVILDTKGNYNNSTCGTSTGAFCGSATITVTPTVYTSTTGTKTTSTTTDHFVVAISWTELNYGKPISITDTYAADILNNTMLN